MWDPMSFAAASPRHPPPLSLPFLAYGRSFTGNAGPTLEFWYHAAVLVLWPRNRSVDLVCKQDYVAALRMGETGLDASRLVEFGLANRDRLYSKVPRSSQGATLQHRQPQKPPEKETFQVLLLLLSCLKKIGPAAEPALGRLVEGLAEDSRASGGNLPRLDDSSLFAVSLLTASLGVKGTAALVRRLAAQPGSSVWSEVLARALMVAGKKEQFSAQLEEAGGLRFLLELAAPMWGEPGLAEASLKALCAWATALFHPSVSPDVLERFVCAAAAAKMGPIALCSALSNVAAVHEAALSGEEAAPRREQLVALVAALGEALRSPAGRPEVKSPAAAGFAAGFAKVAALAATLGDAALRGAVASSVREALSGPSGPALCEPLLLQSAAVLSDEAVAAAAVEAASALLAGPNAGKVPARGVQLLLQAAAPRVGAAPFRDLVAAAAPLLLLKLGGGGLWPPVESLLTSSGLPVAPDGAPNKQPHLRALVEAMAAPAAVAAMSPAALAAAAVRLPAAVPSDEVVVAAARGLLAAGLADENPIGSTTQPDGRNPSEPAGPARNPEPAGNHHVRTAAVVEEVLKLEPSDVATTAAAVKAAARLMRAGKDTEALALPSLLAASRCDGSSTFEAAKKELHAALGSPGPCRAARLAKLLSRARDSLKPDAADAVVRAWAAVLSSPAAGEIPRIGESVPAAAELAIVRGGDEARELFFDAAAQQAPSLASLAETLSKIAAVRNAATASPAVVRLLSARIETLRPLNVDPISAQVLDGVTGLPWNVVEFLKGAQAAAYELHNGVGLPNARKQAVELSRRGQGLLTATPYGTGRNAGVCIAKTAKCLEAARQKAMIEERQTLEAIVAKAPRPSASPAAPVPQAPQVPQASQVPVPQAPLAQARPQPHVEVIDLT